MNAFFANIIRSICGIAAIAFILAGTMALRADLMTQEHPEFGQPWDHHKYLYMAEHPLSFHLAPFCWRIGMPLAVGVLPVGVQTGFFSLSFLGISLGGIMLYSLLRRIGMEHPFPFVGMLLFYSMGWVVKYPLHDFWLPDALAFLAIVAVACAAAKRNDILFAVALVLGVTIKESVFFAAPLYYTLNTKRLLDAGLLARTSLLIIPALAVAGGLRLAIPPLNADPAYLASLPDAVRPVQNAVSSYNVSELARSIITLRISGFSVASMSAYTLRPFSAIALLFGVYGAVRHPGVLVRYAPFFLLVFAQLMFAVNTERLLAAAFPGVVVLALHGMSDIEHQWRIERWWFVLLPAMMIAANCSVDRVSISGYVQLTIVAVWLAFVVLQRQCAHRKGHREK